jgi:hypothetical protein
MSLKEYELGGYLFDFPLFICELVIIHGQDFPETGCRPQWSVFLSNPAGSLIYSRALLG